MSKKELSIFLIYVFITGCQFTQSEPFLAESLISNQQISLETDSLTIDAGDYGMFHYPIFSSAKINDNHYFFGWNNQINQLDVFDLDNQEMIKSISYEMEGPLGLGEVNGLKVVSFDSIFFMSKLYVILADSAKAYESWGINARNEFKGFDVVNHNLTTEESFNIQFDQKQKRLYTRLHFPNYRWCDPKLDYYKENIIAELDLVNKEFKEIDFDFPDHFHRNNFGFRNIPNITYSQSGVINITFSILSNVYQYDLRSSTELVFGGNSHNTDNVASSLDKGACSDMEARMKHNLRNVNFLQLHHDPFKDLYYRFHWGNVSAQKADGKYNSFRDKKLYLTVFDQDLRKVKELEIDRRHGASWCFVNDKGLHVLKPRGKENLLGFNVFKFEKTGS